ncbi:hypothetical protein TrRE_jg762 [Triparma retinervis]|uniref:Uncharacterized protein n=1 Tax=Triparma retinervis TaxID=2557542 RepID=A0A9W7FZF3_9STRA|nr:hypothetical protein TrRE_jg762 [Triparma retinervis]
MSARSNGFFFSAESCPCPYKSASVSVPGRHRSSIVIMWADKRDVGKKKRLAAKKKKERKERLHEEEAGFVEGVAAPRITSDNVGGIGMRKQLAYVKAYNKMVSSPGVSFTKKSQFHRKAITSDPDSDADLRRQQSQDIMAVVGRGSTPLVLVDGYNLLMKSKR